MRFTFRLVVAVFLITLSVLLETIVSFFLQIVKPSNASDILLIVHYLQIGLYILIGLWIVVSISEAIRITTQQKLGIKANVLANGIKYLGYIIVFLVVLIPLGVSSSGLIAGSAFAGLVVGIALQPILSNFFAGLLIMLTGYITVGDKVRIVSTRVPYYPAQLPAYKYFSPDFIEQGYKGTVVEIDLFYSRILLENMRELRIPNIVLLDSSVIDYTSKYSKEQIINIRVEYPLVLVDLDKLEEMVKEEIRDFDIVEGPYISEQSDKEHIVILVRLRVNIDDDWRKIKSDALKRLLKLRQRLIIKSQNSQNLQ